MIFLFFALLAAVPFVLPIISFVRQSRLSARLGQLDAVLAQQDRSLDDLRKHTARLRIAYGRADLDRPRYDLALLAPQVLGTPAMDVVLDAEQTPAAAVTTAGVVSPRLFWGALAIAVIVLLGLVARLLKKPEKSS